jgi:DNA mismatch repair protein MutL
MESHATEFAALGFELEYQGEGRISVMGRPAMVDMSMPLDELIYDLLQGIEDGRLPLEEEQSRLAEVMARRGSQNYGRGLRTADVEVLLKRLETCKNTNFSPSGAPIMAEITMAELQARLMKNYS